MHFRMLIDGHWAEARSGDTWAVLNPATEEVVTTVPFGGAPEAEAAVAAAARAQPAWGAMTPYERGAILLRVSDLLLGNLDRLVAITTREAGKPLAQARSEWIACADLFAWFAEEGKRAYGRTIPARRPGKWLMAVPTPVGVVATITAWNFSAYLPARKWAAALAAGCTVVGRPSELTPLSAMALVNLMVEAGTPPGVINLVNGDPGAMGQVFLQSPVVDKFSFTGSQRVGQILMRGAADGFKRVALEMGGSAPVLVFPDADVSRAAHQAVAARFRNGGQVCISPARFYVHRSIQAAFLDACASELQSYVVGNGMEDGVSVGPLVTAAARDRAESFVADAVNRGARVVAGGTRGRAIGGPGEEVVVLLPPVGAQERGPAP